MLLYEKKQAREKKALLIGNNFMLGRRTKLSFVSKSQFNQDGNVTTPVQFGGGQRGKQATKCSFKVKTTECLPDQTASQLQKPSQIKNGIKEADSVKFCLS